VPEFLPADIPEKAINVVGRVLLEFFPVYLPYLRSVKVHPIGMMKRESCETQEQFPLL